MAQPKNEPDPVVESAQAEEAVDLRMVEAAPETSVKTARFAPLEPGVGPGAQNTMDLLLDVHLELSVELGRAKMPVKEVLQLGPGAVVELNKLGGEPVDILVNGRPIARGEVVVVDENFGVRVTEIVGRGPGAIQL